MVNWGVKVFINRTRCLLFGIRTLLGYFCSLVWWTRLQKYPKSSKLAKFTSFDNSINAEIFLKINSVISISETTAADGKNYNTQFYRLEAILAVGYRVNSTQATDFRRWATETLNEFIIKGFIIDDERLKQGKNLVLNFTDPLERHLCSLVIRRGVIKRPIGSAF